jgi:hypothetical protein
MLECNTLKESNRLKESASGPDRNHGFRSPASRNYVSKRKLAKRNGEEKCKVAHATLPTASFLRNG